MDKLYKNTNTLFLIFARECFNLKLRFAKNIDLYRDKLIMAITVVERCKHGIISEIRCYIKTSKINILHRKNVPAEIIIRNDKIDAVYWYKYGKLHRDDGGPAKIWFDAYVRWLFDWYNDGKLHRIGKPARLQFDNGNIIARQWFENGKLQLKN